MKDLLEFCKCELKRLESDDQYGGYSEWENGIERGRISQLEDIIEEIETRLIEKR